MSSTSMLMACSSSFRAASFWPSLASALPSSTLHWTFISRPVQRGSMRVPCARYLYLFMDQGAKHSSMKPFSFGQGRHAACIPCVMDLITMEHNVDLPPRSHL